MTEYEIRFLGDPVGYLVTTDMALMTNAFASPLWTHVYVGNTTQVVRVDVAKAYRIDVVRARVAPAHEAKP